MKHCEYTIKELIPLYLDQELSKEDVLLVDTHILECEDCRLEFELYRSIHEELSIDDVQLPQHFHESLMNKLSLEHEVKVINSYQTTFYKKYFSYINLVALFTLVVFIGLAGVNRSTKSDMEIATKEATSAIAAESSMEIDAESKEEAKMEIVSEESTMGLAFTEETTEDTATKDAVTEDASSDDTATEDTVNASEHMDESEKIEARVALEESTPSETGTESTLNLESEEKLLKEESSVMTYGVTEEPSLSTEARPLSLVDWFEANVLLGSFLIFMLFILLGGLIGGIIYVKKRK
jgi:hypothetical protein